MAGFSANIEELTLGNNNFRKVLYTAAHCQLVLMCLQPGEEIGMEVHDVDQFLRIEVGQGKSILNGQEHVLKDGSVIVVPAGVEHNIMNTSNDTPLKLYSIYAPPHHKDGTVHVTKKDAEGDEEHFDGVTTE